MTPTEDDVDRLTGAQLAEILLWGGNEPENAAIKLLGAHDNGYWLRQALRPGGSLNGALQNLGEEPDDEALSLDWAWVQRWLAIGTQSSTQLSVLAVAASLAHDHPVVLRKVLMPLSERQTAAIAEAVLHAYDAPDPAF